MTTPATIADELGALELEQLAPLEADNLESVRAHMLKLVASGRGADAIDMLMDLVSRMHEAQTSTAHRLRDALRQLYGRRSEKTSAESLQLLMGFLIPGALQGGSSLPEGAAPAGSNDVPPKRPPQRSAVRGARALPKDIERRVVWNVPSSAECQCPSCGGPRTEMGYEVSERLDLEPMRLFVLEERRPKFACGMCKEGVVAAPAAETPLPGALPGPGLLSQLLVGKYLDGLPLNRQQGIFEKRHGVRLPVSTLGEWLAGASDSLSPLVSLLEERTLADFLVKTDDTGLRVLDKNDARGIKRGHLWVYVGQGPNVFVRYTPDWSGEGPQAILLKRRGFIQADGYAGYNALFVAGSPRTEVSCWMHGRRGFEKAFQAGEREAGIVLAHIQKLYAIERAATDEALTPEQRLERRIALSAPVYSEIFSYLDSLAPNVRPKTLLGKAVIYLRNRYVSLGRFLEDGRIPLDNGEVERLIRVIAVGRNGWLFAGSDEGARRAAHAYSLILSCKQLNVDPWAYFRDVLPKLGDTFFPASRLPELLPEAWVQQQGQKT